MFSFLFIFPFYFLSIYISISFLFLFPFATEVAEDLRGPTSPQTPCKDSCPLSNSQRHISLRKSHRRCGGSSATARSVETQVLPVLPLFLKGIRSRRRPEEVCPEELRATLPSPGAMWKRASALKDLSTCSDGAKLRTCSHVKGLRKVSCR